MCRIWALNSYRARPIQRHRHPLFNAYIEAAFNQPFWHCELLELQRCAFIHACIFAYRNYKLNDQHSHLIHDNVHMHAMYYFYICILCIYKDNAIIHIYIFKDERHVSI